MVNKTKASVLIIGLIAFLVAILVGLVLLFGNLSERKPQTRVQSSETSSTEVKKEKKEVTDKNQENTSIKKLNQTDIQEFLKNYLTYKYLGDNRNVYGPYMTRDLFDVVVAQEEKPVNQAQKELIINQKFEHANIYIDDKENSAICQVYFSNDNLQQKPTVSNPDPKSYRMQNNQELRLSFIKEGNRYLVSAIAYRTVQETDNLN